MNMKKTNRSPLDMSTAHHINIIQSLRVQCADMNPSSPVESYRGGYLLTDHTIVTDNRL